MITKTTNPETLNHPANGSDAIKTNKAKATAKTTKKPKAKAKRAAKGKAKAKGTRQTANRNQTVRIVAKKKPGFKANSYRAKKWACLKDGTTVAANVEAMKKKGLPGAAGFIRVVAEKGFITLNAK